MLSRKREREVFFVQHLRAPYYDMRYYTTIWRGNYNVAYQNGRRTHEAVHAQCCTHGLLIHIFLSHAVIYNCHAGTNARTDITMAAEGRKTNDDAIAFSILSRSLRAAK